MLMNNLDEEVAEDPQSLVVYGGIGRAARNWECFDRIVATLERLEEDQTLLVQSGKPVGVFRTHKDAPRLLIAKSNLVPQSAHWDGLPATEPTSVGLLGNAAEILPEMLKRGIRPDALTDQTSAHDPANGYCPAGWTVAKWQQMRERDPAAVVAEAKQSMARHVEAMLAYKAMGVPTFDYGNNIRQEAYDEGVTHAFDFPGFVPAYVRPLFCRGVGPFRWVALSGDPEDIYRTDAKVKELIPDDRNLHRWLDMARQRIVV